MALDPDDIAKHCLESGVLTVADLEAARSSVEMADRKSGEALTRSLVATNRITEFQAQRLLLGESLVLGNYVVLEELGRGGMGVVYKARHRRMNREVALKVISQSKFDSLELAERFQREVEALAKLSHPNIVAAFDASEADDVHFLVMEFINGKNLAQVIKEDGPMPLEPALATILQVARGLDYAHRRGIVHRDIKPSNLLLTSDGTVKILDLGIVRFEATTDGAVAPEVTQSGMIVGTVDYMAPEQSLDARRADARSDIYSLGCTFFSLLAGHAPFATGTFMERVISHREKKVPSLRETVAESERRTPLCNQAETIFQKMLAKAPSDRYQTMEELISAIKRAQQTPEADGITSRPVSFSTVPARKLLPWLPVAIAAAVAIAFLGWSFLPERAHQNVAPVTAGSGKISAESVSAAASQPVPPPQPVDVNRVAAEWVIRCGGNGMFHAKDGQEARKFSRAEPLPDEPHEISIINLANCALRDDELAVLRPLNRLAWINLENTGIGDAGVTHLSHCRQLWQVVLKGTQVSDACLESLIQLPVLRAVVADATNVTPEGFAKFTSRLAVLSISIPTLEGPEPDVRVANWLVKERGTWDAHMYSRIGEPSPTSILIGDATFSGMRSADSIPKNAWRINGLSIGIDTTAISDEILKELQGLSDLREIDARRSQLSEEQIKSLREALPRCRIESRFGSFEPTSP
jgi:serine/threonine protein kinase